MHTNNDRAAKELYEAQWALNYYCRAIRDTTGCQTCIFGDANNPTVCRCDGRPYQYYVETEAERETLRWIERMRVMREELISR